MRSSRAIWSAAILAAALSPAFLGAWNPARGAEGEPAEPAIRRTPDGLVAVGSMAPGFSLPDANGQTVQLKDLLGKPLVLYFYPADFTTGCTAEACAYRDDSARFDSLGVRVVGISTDDTTSHRAFAEKHRLPFLLLSDTGAVASTLYGVAFEIPRGDAKRVIARRVTYLIDAKGVVRQVWPKVDAETNSVEVLAALKQTLPALRGEERR